MSWPQGKPFPQSVLDQRHTSRANTLLTEAKLAHQGDQSVSEFGSILHWDSLCLRRSQPGKRKRRFLSVTCGKCKKHRWLSYDNVCKQLRRPSFTGLCYKCSSRLTWQEKHRDRPLQRKVNSSGYIKIFLGLHHPLADSRGEMFEHRFIVSQIVGRPLHRYEHVHHKNGDRADNRPENLELLPAAEHNSIKDLMARLKLLETLLIKHNIPIP